MVKAIIFDFFGVLVTEGFRLFCDTYFPGDKTKRAKALDLVNRHDLGQITKNEYVAQLSKLATVSLTEVEKHMGNNQPNKQLLEYIAQKLKPKYKVSVLSNSGDDYIGQLFEEAAVELFDDIILSYRHGMAKPDKEIYDFAAKRLGVTPAQCVFIDDSATHIAGAKRADMRAILYREFEQMTAELDKLLGK